MFNKIKQIKDLRSQAKTLQNTLAQESITTEKAGITIIMNGNSEITSLKISDNAKNNLEENMKNAVNEAVKNMLK
mgnify:CR=1 FL=1